MVAEEVAHRWTREEYERVVALGAFEGWKIELVNGILCDMPPKSPRHSGSVSKFLRALREVSSGQGLDLSPQMPLAISADSLPEPDIAVIPEDPEGDFYCAAHPTTAVLVVEIADLSLQYDREVKAELYARAGIPEYWIANLVDRQLEVHREPAGSSYASRTVLSLVEEIAPLFAPEASIPISHLFPKEPRRADSAQPGASAPGK
jgi:Uma2 family endonuclease